MSYARFPTGAAICSTDKRTSRRGGVDADEPRRATSAPEPYPNLDYLPSKDWASCPLNAKLVVKG